MNGPMKEWDALGSDWREQAVPAVDVEALRGEAGRQGRRLRWTLVAETFMALLAMLLVGWIALREGAVPMERWLFGALALSMIPYQGYVLWRRRHDWSEAGLDAEALVELELRRCAGTEHYWRFGMWSVLVLWVVIFAVLMAGLHGDWPIEQVSGLVGALGANVVVIPLIGLYGLARCRGARQRRERLLALRGQLRGP
ncbi:hypothetical protein [Arenimonas sp. SCN 70-307]|uniref:hypothetical protein n=1 Tax=Arenimonas sp. SCN 70-307 TaxID=1660089 RepID=UPI0025B8152D|nr:hypothetical protein [Arenimonas sp. SCN 70-307]